MPLFLKDTYLWGGKNVNMMMLGAVQKAAMFKLKSTFTAIHSLVLR